MNDELPPGQRARSDFPRFGLTPYAYRFPEFPERAQLVLSGDVLDDATLDSPLAGLIRVEHTCDFHCVTTWTRQKVQWGGVRFAEFYSQRIEPRVYEGTQVRTVVLRGQDGYRTTLLLSDLLAEDVLIADRLDGTQLSVEHGAPLRLVAPAHYGYKSVKHLSRLEFWQGVPSVRPAAFAFMDHPRARVAYEERGRWLPGWLLRLAYRPLIRSTAERFAKALALHQPSP
jgi:DMSO/TMAO reductase YedYZ molybdopterin-dependent catalytic subunit